MSAVTNTSTFSPATRMPPTARSSGTEIATARHSGESGPNDSAGPKMASAADPALNVNRLDVIIWPGRIGTPDRRPTMASVLLNVPWANAWSRGTSRTTRSSGAIGVLAAMVRAATTTETRPVDETAAPSWAR